MKKKALATKMAAFVMAGAMTMAMGFPAFAETIGTTTSNTRTITFTKTIIDNNTKADSATRAATNVYAPNAKFKFELTSGSTGTIQEGTNGDGKEIPVLEGKTDADGKLIGIALGSDFIEMSPNTTQFNNSGNDTITINYDEFYNVHIEPGVYHYQLKELDPKTANDRNYTAYDGMNYEGANTTYDIYVFLYGQNEKNLNNVVVKKDGIKQSTLNFENTYTTYNLDVKKIVTGNQGIKDNDYRFTITVNGTDGEKYKYITYRVTENNETALTDKTGTLVNGTGAEITLKSDELIRIFGLSEGDKYTVTENDYSTDGYTTTVTVNNGEVQNVREVKAATNEKLTGDVSIVYTNDKTITTPTGIVTEYAPYILLVAAAGAFAVLFLRRKKEEF